VSDYQLYSPKEWFAEAYQAFYDPAGDPLHQNPLRLHDRATADYFVQHVHKRAHG
jgi:hypothetical protein